MRPRSIAILGGGVIGITTALHLRRLGFETELITESRADKMMGNHSVPEFATLFAPALIAPHTVESTLLDELFDVSQESFAKLAGTMGEVVRWQQHYELFAAQPSEIPSYAKRIRDYAPYGTSRKHLHFEPAMRRDLWGWVGEYLFVEMGSYVPYLYREYMMAGGRMTSMKLRLAELADLTADVIVNCTGIGAREIFNDDALYPIRGHLLFVEGPPIPPRHGAPPFSYNYTPPEDDYAYDVYFFPSIDTRPRGINRWILGGSREMPQQDRGELWRTPLRAYTTVDGIPSPMYHINQSIIKIITGGIDIEQFPRKSVFGYRPGRRGGIRLELAEEFGKPVVHNYGHGGAGVTLSWGCAEKVAKIIAYM